MANGFVGNNLQTAATVLFFLTLSSVFALAYLAYRIFFHVKDLGTQTTIGMTLSLFFISMVQLVQSVYWIGISASKQNSPTPPKRNLQVLHKSPAVNQKAANTYKKNHFALKKDADNVVAITKVSGFINDVMDFDGRLTVPSAFKSIQPTAFVTLHYGNECVACPKAICEVRCSVHASTVDYSDFQGKVHLLWKMHQLAKDNKVPDFISVQLELGNSGEVGNVCIVSNPEKVLVVKESVQSSYREWADSLLLNKSK